MPSLKYPIEIAYCTVSLMKDLVLIETMALCSWGSEHKIWCNKLMRIKDHKVDIPWLAGANAHNVISVIFFG